MTTSLIKKPKESSGKKLIHSTRNETKVTLAMTQTHEKIHSWCIKKTCNLMTKSLIKKPKKTKKAEEVGGRNAFILRGMKRKSRLQ